jgi:hypothetical protein
VPADLGYGGREARWSSMWRASPGARVARRPSGERRRARRRSGLAGKGKELLVPRLRPWADGTSSRANDVYRRFSRRFPSGRQRQRQGDLTPCHFQRIAHRGACGKTRVGPQNRRPDQERTKAWGHDAGVLLSTDGRRGDEPLVGLAVRLRVLGAEVRVCARCPTGRGGKAARDEDVPNKRRETPVIRPASAGQRSAAASEVSR